MNWLLCWAVCLYLIHWQLSEVGKAWLLSPVYRSADPDCIPCVYHPFIHCHQRHCSTMTSREFRELTPDDSPNKRGMSRTIHQGELQVVILLLASTVPQMIRKIHREGGEAEVQRDASLTGLRVLVEGSGGGGAAQRPGERRLPAVDMSKHPDIEVQRLGATVSRL